MRELAPVAAVVAASIGSCPDGNAPTILQTYVHESGVTLRWTKVADVIDYHIALLRQDAQNHWVPIQGGTYGIFIVNSATSLELQATPGKYWYQIRTHSCGQFYGPWTTGEAGKFTVEYGDNDAAPSVRAEQPLQPPDAPNPVPQPVPTPVPTPGQGKDCRNGGGDHNGVRPKRRPSSLHSVQRRDASNGIETQKTTSRTRAESEGVEVCR